MKPGSTKIVPLPSPVNANQFFDSHVLQITIGLSILPRVVHAYIDRMNSFSQTNKPKQNDQFLKNNMLHSVVVFWNAVEV